MLEALSNGEFGAFADPAQAQANGKRRKKLAIIMPLSRRANGRKNAPDQGLIRTLYSTDGERPAEAGRCLTLRM